MANIFSKKLLVFLGFVFSFVFFLTIANQVKAIDTSAPTWNLPKMQISIPAVSFSKPIICDSANGQNIYCVNWIGEYISGIYKYAIGIVGILAAIMLMVGGVVWLTSGGSPDKVKQAQDYIKGSITGLVLALTSYLILYQINPDLVAFKPIRVAKVEKVAVTAVSCESQGGKILSNVLYEYEANKLCDNQCRANKSRYLRVDKIGEKKDSLGYTRYDFCCFCEDFEMQNLAESILANPNITLGSQEDCKGYGPVKTMSELKDKGMASACNKSCICNTLVSVNKTMLEEVDRVAKQYSLTVTSITTGIHDPNSPHYQGRGVDIVPSSADVNVWNTIINEFNKKGEAHCDLSGKYYSDCSQIIGKKGAHIDVKFSS